MAGFHETIIKLSKTGIVFAVICFITMIGYIATAIGFFASLDPHEHHEVEFPWWTIVCLGLMMVSVIIFMAVDAVSGVVALVHVNDFHEGWVPWAIVCSCAVAFFVSPFIGFCGMIVNIMLCRMDIAKESDDNNNNNNNNDNSRSREEERAGLINNSTGTITTATVVYPIPSSSSSSSSSSTFVYATPVQQIHPQQQHQQPVYYAPSAQYPIYSQQRASVVPMPSVNATAPRLPAAIATAIPPPPPPPPPPSSSSSSSSSFGYGRGPSAVPAAGASSAEAAVSAAITSVYPQLAPLPPPPPPPPPQTSSSYGYPTYIYQSK